jgi:hypothetical protein
VRSSLAGRPFEDVVVDVSFSEPIGRTDVIIGPNLLAFADLSPIHVPTLPLPIHVAEKVHAYTRRYGLVQRPSTRVKDLVDLVLLSTMNAFRARDLEAALQRTFSARATHPLPTALPEPPTEWAGPYRRLAQSLSIPTDSRDGHRIVAAFLDPILDGTTGDDAWWGESSGQWSPARRSE